MYKRQVLDGYLRVGSLTGVEEEGSGVNACFRSAFVGQGWLLVQQCPANAHDSDVHLQQQDTLCLDATQRPQAGTICQPQSKTDDLSLIHI